MKGTLTEGGETVPPPVRRIQCEEAFVVPLEGVVGESC